MMFTIDGFKAICRHCGDTMPSLNPWEQYDSLAAYCAAKQVRYQSWDEVSATRTVLQMRDGSAVISTLLQTQGD